MLAAPDEFLVRDGNPENDGRCEIFILYCKLILVEMSHSSVRQKQIIQAQGIEYLESLDKFSQARTQKKYINYFKRH